MKSAFSEANSVIFGFLKHFKSFCKISIFQIVFCLTIDTTNEAVRDTLQTYGYVIEVY
jgi:hypothetical protein